MAAAGGRGLKRALKIQMWWRMCKLMLLTWRGERAAPCTNAEDRRDLARSEDNTQIWRCASTLSSGFNRPPSDWNVVLFAPLHTEMSARWCWGNEIYLRYLPEQLPLCLEDPLGSLEVPERHTTARIGLDDNTRRASPFQLLSWMEERTSRRKRGWQSANLLHGDIHLHLICPTEESSDEKNVSSKGYRILCKKREISSPGAAVGSWNLWEQNLFVPSGFRQALGTYSETGLS